MCLTYTYILLYFEKCISDIANTSSWYIILIHSKNFPFVSVFQCKLKHFAFLYSVHTVNFLSKLPDKLIFCQGDPSFPAACIFVLQDGDLCLSSDNDSSIPRLCFGETSVCKKCTNIVYVDKIRYNIWFKVEGNIIIQFYGMKLEWIQLILEVILIPDLMHPKAWLVASPVALWCSRSGYRAAEWFLTSQYNDSLFW